jgi:hypothetical protein
VIGATAHYAAPDLDEGPIIEQAVTRITHTMTAAQVTQLGRDNECLGTRARRPVAHREQSATRRQANSRVPVTVGHAREPDTAAGRAGACPAATSDQPGTPFTADLAGPTGEARFRGGWIGYLGFANLMRNDLSRPAS